jgi:D-galactose 1-dehydrogenase
MESLSVPSSTSLGHERRILLIGFGKIAQYHVAAIANTPGLELVGAVDPAPAKIWNYKGSPVLVYPSLEDAASTRANTVVILTPTGTHVDVTRLAMTTLPGSIVLIEKPFALPSEDTSDLFMLSHRTRSRYLTIYHMAYSPEVRWAVARVASTHYGAVTGFTSQFLDPYAQDPANAITSLHSSWWDSGPNALSVLNRFFSFGHVSSLTKSDSHFSTYAARLDGFVWATRRIIRGGVFTSWDATAPSQTTRLRMGSDIEIVMDHTSVTGYVTNKGTVVEFFSGDPMVPRREAHYRNLYQELALGGPKSISITDTYSIQRVLSTKVTPGPGHECVLSRPL